MQWSRCLRGRDQRDGVRRQCRQSSTQSLWSRRRVADSSSSVPNGQDLPLHGRPGNCFFAEAPRTWRRRRCCARAAGREPSACRALSNAVSRGESGRRTAPSAEWSCRAKRPRGRPRKGRSRRRRAGGLTNRYCRLPGGAHAPPGSVAQPAGQLSDLPAFAMHQHHARCVVTGAFFSNRSAV